MWQRTAIILAWGLVLLPGPAVRSQEMGYGDSLLADLDWVRFDVVRGRILATGHRTKQDRQRAQREHPDGARETLTVTLDRGLVSLRYGYRSDQRELSIHIVRRDRLELVSCYVTLAGAEHRVSYTQSPGEDVGLTIATTGETPREYAAPSVWHLVLAHPAVCQRHLNPLLTIFRPNWNIDQEAAEIRRGLLSYLPVQASTSRREVELLVTQMRHDDFRVRQRSARDLRSRGPSVLGFLDDLDPATLDAEQRLRVGSIREELTPHDEDTPARMVAQLVSDKAAWLALLYDESPQHRTHAWHHLVHLCEPSVDFDPQKTGSDHAAQLANLSVQLLRR